MKINLGGNRMNSITDIISTLDDKLYYDKSKYKIINWIKYKLNSIVINKCQTSIESMTNENSYRFGYWEAYDLAVLYHRIPDNENLYLLIKDFYPDKIVDAKIKRVIIGDNFIEFIIKSTILEYDNNIQYSYMFRKNNNVDVRRVLYANHKSWTVSQLLKDGLHGVSYECMFFNKVACELIIKPTLNNIKNKYNK